MQDQQVNGSVLASLFNNDRLYFGDYNFQFRLDSSEDVVCNGRSGLVVCTVRARELKSMKISIKVYQQNIFELT